MSTETGHKEGAAASEQRAGAPVVTVIVPARDAGGVLAAQLERLSPQAQSLGAHIFVVDDGSTDDTAEVASRFPSVRVLPLDGRGVSAARNAGVRHSRSPYVCFVDADDVVAEGWLPAMVHCLQRHDAVCGPLEVHRLSGGREARAQAGSWQNELHKFERVLPIGGAGNFGIRRSLLVDVGGFDESLGVGEDLDLCFRLWRTGVTLTFCPEALVHYRLRRFGWPYLRQQFRYGRAAQALTRQLALVGAISRWQSLVNHVRRGVWLVRHVHLLALESERVHWCTVAAREAGRLTLAVRRGKERRTDA